MDEEASYTVKNNEAHYRYKAHVSTEAATSMIQKVEYTTAKVHDSQVFEQLDTGEVLYRRIKHTGQRHEMKH